MKGLLHRYLITTIVGALSLGLLLTGLVQAQKQEDKKPEARNKPAAEKKEAPRPGKTGEKTSPTPDSKPTPSRDRLNPQADRTAHAHQGEPVTFLGVAATEVPDAVRAHLDLPPGIGITIGQIMPESPAAKTDLKAYDVLTKLDDQLLVTPEQFQILVRMKKPGDKVKLTYLRAGEERTLDIALASRRVAFTETRPFPQKEFRFNPHDPRHRNGDDEFGGSDQWRDLQHQWSEKMRDWWEKNGDEISDHFRKAMNEAFDSAEDLGSEADDLFDDLRERREQRESTPNKHRERPEPQEKDKDAI